MQVIHYPNELKDNQKQNFLNQISEADLRLLYLGCCSSLRSTSDYRVLKILADLICLLDLEKEEFRKIFGVIKNHGR